MAQFVVIGLGRFGMAAALELARLGNSVIGVDTNEKLVEQAADALALTIVADGSDEQSLREINIKECDSVLVAIGESLEESLLCVLQLKTMGVKDIWAKAITRPHHDILNKLDVTKIVHPEEDMGVRVAQSLNYPMVSQYMTMGYGMFLVDIDIEHTSNEVAVTKLIKDTDANIQPILVRREQHTIHPIPEDFVLQINDSLIVSGTLEALKKIAPRFHA